MFCAMPASWEDDQRERAGDERDGVNEPGDLDSENG